VRARLFGIAYRMLGSAAEAEDIVQDVWLRWEQTNRRVVENPAAFLATTTTRLCINLLQSAKTRRETYVGTWLPETVDPSSDPWLGVERGEALQLRVLLLLEKLSPTERAAYVLRDYSYRQIADILQLEEANARQVVSRALKHIANGRRSNASSDEQRRLLEAFIGAAQKVDMIRLELLFAEHVVSYANGGGIVRAARVPVAGRERVAKFIAASRRISGEGSRSRGLRRTDNCPFSCGAMVRQSASYRLMSEQRIDQIIWILRPSKLSTIPRPA
jgi:RNA polymerase sigma-70 factor (ECF subfamily)